MNAARLTSPRLMAVHELLAERGPAGATTREIQTETGSCAVHSEIAELRANGLQIACTFEGRSPLGRRIYRYTLVPRAEGTAA